MRTGTTQRQTRSASKPRLSAPWPLVCGIQPRAGLAQRAMGALDRAASSGRCRHGSAAAGEQTEVTDARGGCCGLGMQLGPLYLHPPETGGGESMSDIRAFSNAVPRRCTVCRASMRKPWRKNRGCAVRLTWEYNPGTLRVRAVSSRNAMSAEPTPRPAQALDTKNWSM